MEYFSPQPLLSISVPRYQPYLLRNITHRPPRQFQDTHGGGAIKEEEEEEKEGREEEGENGGERGLKVAYPIRLSYRFRASRRRIPVFPPSFPPSLPFSRPARARRSWKWRGEMCGAGAREEEAWAARAPRETTWGESEEEGREGEGRCVAQESFFIHLFPGRGAWLVTEQAVWEGHHVPALPPSLPPSLLPSLPTHLLTPAHSQPVEARLPPAVLAPGACLVQLQLHVDPFLSLLERRGRLWREEVGVGANGGHVVL